MGKGQVIAVALALVLAALAARVWWSDVQFMKRATRVSGTLVAFDTVEVRSLFSVEAELHPVVTFIDGAGTTHRFSVQSTAERVGVRTDTPLGSELGALVLYDPADPTKARLESERRGRGGLVLLIAAAGLLLTPRVLAWAFRDRGVSR